MAHARPRAPYSSLVARPVLWWVIAASVITACGGDHGGWWVRQLRRAASKERRLARGGDITAAELAEECEATVADAQAALDRYRASVTSPSVEEEVRETTSTVAATTTTAAATTTTSSTTTTHVDLAAQPSDHPPTSSTANPRRG